MTKSTSLASLQQQKVTTGFNKLQSAGVTPRMWLHMLNATDVEMQKLAAAWPQPARVYDAVRILGFGDESDTELPEAAEGEVIIRYGGWSLQELRGSGALMHPQDWYNNRDWSTEKLPSGIYRVRLPIPLSNRTGLEGQKKLLLPGEDPAHIVLEATALLCHKMKTGADLLNGDWVRTHHPTQGGYFAALHWHDGRLRVDDLFGGGANEHIWFGGSARAS